MSEFAEYIDGIAFVNPDIVVGAENQPNYPEGFDIDPPSVAFGIEWAGGQKVRWEVFKPYEEDDGIRNY